MTNAPVSAGTYALSESAVRRAMPRRRGRAWAERRPAHRSRSRSASRATCTINNNDMPAQLTLVKTVTNDNGGTAARDRLDVARGGADADQRRDGSAAVTAAPVSAGTYTLSESGPAGYAASAWSCVGGTQTGRIDRACARCSRRRARSTTTTSPAQLTLVKTVTNDNGGTAVPTEWTLHAAGPTPIVGCDGQRRGDGRAGECGHVRAVGDGRSGGLCRVGVVVRRRHANRASIALALGESATCTINNNDIAAAVDLGEEGHQRRRRHCGPDRLDVDRDRADADLGSTGEPAVTDAPVSAGTYVLSEAGPAGYAASAWSCTGRDTDRCVDRVRLGESATCTIMNDDIPAPLTLVKQVVNDDGGTAVADRLDVDGRRSRRGSAGPTGDRVGDGGAGERRHLRPVGVRVPGYAASAWSCVGGTQTGARHVGAG